MLHNILFLIHILLLVNTLGANAGFEPKQSCSRVPVLNHYFYIDHLKQDLLLKNLPI